MILLLSASGCVSSTRETQTARTSTEVILLSRAAERAVRQYSAARQHLSGLLVAIDDSRFDSVDKPYVLGALRHYLNESGATLIPMAGQKFKDAEGRERLLMPRRIVEIRSGALGIRDDGFGFGTPLIPAPIPWTTLNAAVPPFKIIYRDKQRSWAKFQLWVYDPRRRVYLFDSPDLWGSAYYSQWWFLLFGPFDFSNDLYPDDRSLPPRRVPEGEPKP